MELSVLLFLWHKNNPAFLGYFSFHTSPNNTRVTVLAVYARDALQTAKWTRMQLCFQAMGSDHGQSMVSHRSHAELAKGQPIWTQRYDWTINPLYCSEWSYCKYCGQAPSAWSLTIWWEEQFTLFSNFIFWIRLVLQGLYKPMCQYF